MLVGLAATYLTDPKCLVLLTVSMQGLSHSKSISSIDDFGNSEAVVIANKYDISGERRIGDIYFQLPVF